MLLVLLHVGCLLPCASTDGMAVSMNSKDFRLDAEVVEALEGGPVVVKATVAYCGDGRVQICDGPLGSRPELQGPRGWRPKTVPFSLVGVSVGTLELAPGAKKTETLLVHHEYTNIGSGKATVTVKWPIYAPSTDGKNPGALIADLSVPLEIDIEPATPAKLAALRTRMEDKLRQPDLSWEERCGLARDILETRHAALAAVAWRLIESPKLSDPTPALIAFVSECPDDSRDLDARLARLEANPDWCAGGDAFQFWRNRQTELRGDAWKTLTEAESVWVRAMTYAVFPKRCTKEWKESLLQGLRDQGKPLPQPQFDRLLADLDNDDYQVREKASARLMRLGERVAAPLRQALDRPVSEEARQRITVILGKLKQEKQPPDCVRALEYLAAHDAPEDGEILQVLADGQPDAWLTREAKAKLAEWRTDRGLPDK